MRTREFGSSAAMFAVLRRRVQPPLVGRFVAISSCTSSFRSTDTRCLTSLSKMAEDEVLIDALNEISGRIGLQLKNPHLYLPVLDFRSSALSEARTHLSSLGFMLANLCVVRRMYEMFPNMPSRYLHELKTSLVGRERMSALSRDTFGKFVIDGKQLRESGELERAQMRQLSCLFAAIHCENSHERTIDCMSNILINPSVDFPAILRPIVDKQASGSSFIPILQEILEYSDLGTPIPSITKVKDLRRRSTIKVVLLSSALKRIIGVGFGKDQHEAMEEASANAIIRTLLVSR